MDVHPAPQHDTNDIRFEGAEYRLGVRAQSPAQQERGAKTPKDRNREQAKRAAISTPLIRPCRATTRSAFERRVHAWHAHETRGGGLMDVPTAAQHDTNDIRLEEAEYRLGVRAQSPAQQERSEDTE